MKYTSPGQTAEAIEEQEHLILTSWEKLAQKSKERRRKLDDSLHLYNLTSTVGLLFAKLN